MHIHLHAHTHTLTQPCTFAISLFLSLSHTHTHTHTPFYIQVCPTHLTHACISTQNALWGLQWPCIIDVITHTHTHTHTHRDMHASTHTQTLCLPFILLGHRDRWTMQA